MVEKLSVSPEQVRRWRWSRQGLDADPDARLSLDEISVLDLGVQETGPIGAVWSLAARGVDPRVLLSPEERAEDEGRDGLVCVWSLRGAPCLYRRSDIAAVAAAVAPYDETDATKRVFDAAKQLRDKGIAVLDALRTQAELQRELVAEPTVKGELSAALTGRLPAEQIRDCRPCGAEHPWENPFRMSALQAGLELQQGTSPPVLQQIPDLEPPMFDDSAERDPRFDPVRGYLRLYGPATHRAVAGFLDGAVAAVKDAWPEQVREVEVAGLSGRRWILAEDADELEAVDAGSAAGDLRLLGPFDPYLQGRDRELLADKDRRKQLWPSLGRPGAVVIDGDLAGVWRPKSAGKKLTIRLERWRRLTKDETSQLQEQAQRLAQHRDQQLTEVRDETSS